jgi:signal transduction histidine kinase
MLRIKPVSPDSITQPLSVNEEYRLLIVDDERDILLTLHELFSPHYTVRTAESGTQALSIIKSGFIPQVILADQRMPGMSGTEFFAHTISLMPQTVRVVLTGYTDVQDLTDSINQGNVYRFLTKPWRNADLLEIIRVCFQHYHLSEEKTALMQALERLEYINNEKTEILSLVAHDLRSPVSTIQTMAEIIAQGTAMGLTVERYEELGTQITTITDRMTRLIKNLLDAHALEEGKLPLNFVTVGIAQTLAVLLKEFTPKAEAKNISIDFKPESEPNISVDEVWFYQIIDNLLLNAVKYSPQGTTVQVRVYEDAGNAFISVHDQGPGISDEDRTKLFHRFAKLSARPTGGENSTGLGLSTVKKLVEKMNGSVWCESGTEVGAVFILQFPLC